MLIDWLDLDHPPALPRLFLRAALKRGVNGLQLPSIGVRTSVTIDPAHLQRYRHICALAPSPYLPPVYPHVLAFALQMQLITDARFPFPVLGLVHLHNHIRVERALAGTGPFTLSVHLQDLQPHSKGATFSLITRLEDQLGLLWEGDSRMLCRSARLDGAVPQHIEEQALPLSPLTQWDAPANTGRRYAQVAGDYNPIHMTALSARLFGFPRAIAHGLWNKARCLEALSAHLPIADYSATVRFQRPVLLPSQVTLLASAQAARGQFQLIGHSSEVHLSGQWQSH